ncbi:MAG: hypothetical protein JO101_02000 [Candidatus Eremiobacteraeota bacterium]|nr:hypothetical protein [Candidatus Eremiobacteraeota bacterium]
MVQLLTQVGDAGILRVDLGRDLDGLYGRIQFAGAIRALGERELHRDRALPRVRAAWIDLQRKAVREGGFW